MASYIVDNEIEEKEACWATILDLECKGYLKIDKSDENNYNIIVTEKIIKDLYVHEKYILNCLRSEKKIDLSNFVYLVINDCIDSKLVVISGSVVDKIFKYLFIFEFILAFFVSISVTCLLIFIILLIVLYIIHFFRVISKRRTKGYMFAVEMMGLKNYIRDYTLLNEKDITDNILVGKYLPYAIVLGETEKIENKYMMNSYIESKYFR